MEPTAKVRNFVQAREKTTRALEELKRPQSATESDWLQAHASETANHELNLDRLVSRYREAMANQQRAQEKIAAAEFFVGALDKQLDGYKRSDRETVAYFLKETIRSLSEKRDAQQKDKGYFNARIEKLLTELRELEPPSNVAAPGEK